MIEWFHLIRSITQNAMDNKFSIRQFPSPEHPYTAFPQKNLAVLDISRFTTGEIGPQSRLESIIPDTLKSANVIPVPTVNRPNTIEKDARPISLTPIASKTLESIILNMVNEKNEENINRNQFGGMEVASTTDGLVEMIHRWSEATDKLDHYVRVALLDFSKALDLINHNTTFEVQSGHALLTL